MPTPRHRPFRHARHIGLATAAAFAVFAPAAAHAGQATLWACHGPGGQALGTIGLTPAATGDGVTSTFGSGCDAPVSALGQGGVRAALPAPAAAGSSAAWSLEVPRAVTLTGVAATRRTAGFGSTPLPDSGLRYAATTPTDLIESRSTEAGDGALDGSFATSTSGTSVRFAVTCAPPAVSPCTAPVAVELGSLGATVTDDQPPRGAVGGIVSPAVGTLNLALRASDAGLGLAEARVLVDGTLVSVVDIGGATCAELSPTDTTVDIAAGATCPESVTDLPMAVDTTTLPDGEHRLEVIVRDVSGNAVTVADELIVVANTRRVQSSTAILNLGSGGTPTGGAGGTPPGTGGEIGGAGGTPGSPGTVACARPRLTMALSQRPLRRSRGVALVRRNARYRFTGRLTCVVGGRRVSAPQDTVVEILNTIGRRTVRKSGTTVRRSGQITAILAYPSTRLIRFRFRSADGSVAQASIRIIVSRRASA